MRTKLGWLCIGFIVMVGCSKSGSKVFLLGGADSEANDAARRYMERRYTQCGDSFYSADTPPYGFITQTKAQKWSVQRNFTELTEAEKLNRKIAGIEIEWQGEISVRCSVGRTYDQFRGYWNQWRDDLCRLNGGPTMAKVNGVWLYGGYPGSGSGTPLEIVPKSFVCQRIPPG
jgi:hypothetical protein